MVRLSGYGVTSGSVNTAVPLVHLTAPATPGASKFTIAAALPAFPTLWINEVQAQNLTGPTNSAGQRTPWLEIYNPGTNTISLNGLYLSANYSNLLQWAFPAGSSISPGQFKTVFADGQTALSTLTELHTSFVLPAGTGSLALSPTLQQPATSPRLPGLLEPRHQPFLWFIIRMARVSPGWSSFTPPRPEPTTAPARH